MRVLVTGSTGFIGSALVGALEQRGDRVVRLGRGTATDGGPTWDPEAGTISTVAFDGVDAVVHLAGEGIGEKKWTPEQKRRILDSRVKGTTLLARTLADLPTKPAVLVSGSAIGYYGNRGDEELDETSSSGDDFLADVCTQWEVGGATRSRRGYPAGDDENRHRAPPERGRAEAAAAAVPVGARRPRRKRQAVDELDHARRHRRRDRARLDHDTLHGPVNLTAPNPVTNAGAHQGARRRGAPPHDPADAAAAAEAALRGRARRGAPRRRTTGTAAQAARRRIRVRPPISRRHCRRCSRRCRPERTGRHRKRVTEGTRTPGLRDHNPTL